MFYLALPVSGLIGNPVSGWIMETFAGVNGWRGWQWLFLVEGIPSVLLGVIAYFYLDDRPDRARWLTADEGNVVAAALAAEETGKTTGRVAHGLIHVLRDPRLYVLGAVSFSSWTIPSGYLSKSAAAGGIALVTTIGAMGAAISPVVLGWTRTRNGEFSTGLYLTAAVVVIGSVTLIAGMPARLLPSRDTKARR